LKAHCRDVGRDYERILRWSAWDLLAEPSASGAAQDGAVRAADGGHPVGRHAPQVTETLRRIVKQGATVSP